MRIRQLLQHCSTLSRRAWWHTRTHLTWSTLRASSPLLRQKPWLAMATEGELLTRIKSHGDPDDLAALLLRGSTSVHAELVTYLIEQFPDQAIALLDVLGERLAQIPRIETVWENAWKSSIQPACTELVQRYLHHLVKSSTDPDKTLATLQCGHNPWRLELLLEHGPTLIQAQGKQPRHLLGSLGRQALRVAVRELNSKPLSQWIQAINTWKATFSGKGTPLDMYHDGAWTPALISWCQEWHGANHYVRQPDMQALQLLLEAGASVNVRDAQGVSLIERMMVDFEKHQALRRFSEEEAIFLDVSALLVEHGADWLSVSQATRQACVRSWDALGRIPQVRRQRLTLIGGWGRSMADTQEQRRM